MNLTFNASTGLTAPDTGDIREAVATDWVSAFNSDDGTPALDTSAVTPAGQLIDSETALLAEANTNVLYLTNQFNPRVAEGIWQDAIGAIYGLNRRVASPTIVDCVCTGLQGTVITEGAIVQDTSGYKYTALNNATIPASGSITVSFANTQNGAIACASHAINKIITVIAGWDSVDNTVAGTGGAETEIQAEFEARRQATLAGNARGSVKSLSSALADIDGVADVEVLENATATSLTVKGVSVSPYSVAICVYGGLGADIAEAIYNKKSAGCGTTGSTVVSYTDTSISQTYSYNIVRPTATDVLFTVQIDASVSNPQDVVSRVKNAIISDFNGTGDNPRVGLGMTVFVSRFYSAIMKSGVAGLLSVKLGYTSQSLADSLTINADIEPITTVSDITVSII